MDDNNKKRISVALGDFDGMHRAHNTVVTGGDDAIIFCVNNRFSLLQRSLFEKKYPNAIFADFDTLRDMPAEDFINDILIGRFGAGMVLCGFNFRFGKGASWTALNLREYLEKKDIWVRILEHVDYKDAPISSTRIRLAITNGEIEDANAMLGYNFTFESDVIRGDQRGRTISFPTINQHLPDGLVVPKFGVYESRVFVGDREYKAFTNVGIRPTWRVDKPLCETHIFDFSGDLYDQSVRVELVRYIREERVFSSVDELREQLIYDKGCII